MKCFLAVFLCFLFLPSLAIATTLTLSRDADLINTEGQKIMTIKAGEAFRYERIDGDWVSGAYYHDEGVAKGKVASDAFKQQAFLKRAAADHIKKMREQGLVKYEGEWIPAEEKERRVNEASGLVLYNDEWITPEERDRRIAEEEKAEEPDPENGEDVTLVDDPFGAGEDDPSIEDVPDEGNPDETEDPSPSIDNPFEEEPGIEDLSDPSGNEKPDPVEPEERDEGSQKKGIDWDKAAGKAEDEPKDPVAMFSKIFFPGLVGMGIILVLICVLSARKGRRG